MNKQAFYAALRSRNSGIFGTSLGQRQVDGIEGLLAAFATHGDGKRDTLAYGLATAYHETGARMVPVREGFATTDAGARAAVARLAAQRGPHSPPARYGKSTPPHGHAYYGRGHIQLTWNYNYRGSSKDAGVDLIKNPDAMLDPEISARVLWRGLLDGRWNRLGEGLRHYLDQGDLTGARRTVNVQDKASLIAGYHQAFEAALKVAGMPTTVPQRAPQPQVAVPAPVTQQREAQGFLSWLGMLFAWRKSE